MRIALRHRQQQVVLTIQRAGNGLRVVADHGEHVVESRYLDQSTLFLTIDGHRYRVAVGRNGCEHFVAVAGETYTFIQESGVHATRSAASHSVASIAAPEITAPMPGKVLQVLAREGDHVIAGDGLLILEAMKMENRLVAEAAATVAEMRVAAGDMVEGGQVLVVLRYDAEPEGRA